MASDYTGRRNSSTQILQELEALSESLYQWVTLNPKLRSRRMSLSPWRSQPKLNIEESGQREGNKASATKESKSNCLFSVEVVTIQGLPASMNGLRLSVCIRKKDNRDGAVQTMPSRVSQGAADFEETLFIRCRVYSTPRGGTHMIFEPRQFLIYVLAVDAEELDFGRRSVDLSKLIQESTEKSFEGTRVGELVLKLGFQIMERDEGIGIYSQAEGQKTGSSRNYSPYIARKQSKSSFSVPSPRMSSRAEAWTPSQKGAASDLQGIDDLNLDEPAPLPSTPTPLQKLEEPETKMDDNDLPDFDVGEEEEQPEEDFDKRSVSSEVVKEVAHDQSHLTRLTELDSIAQHIKALESMMGEDKVIRTDEETASQTLDAEEDKKPINSTNNDEIPPLKLEGDENTEEAQSEVFVPEHGKGLGCVVQAKNGGYLAAMNPLDTAVERKDTPKLALKVSKPLQIAFEGIASAIIQGRDKEGASSSPARTIAAVSEDPLTVGEILAFSMQKIESMAVDALKIQADKMLHLMLTALQWLVAYGIGNGGKKGKHLMSKGPDLMWSISSRVMADMCGSNQISNPDIKFTK
ncbi:hypothetical protein Pfo_016594 [Paulownia fortunei]|nr:hypothetical protein Pfo_016594 [Paulownia fortunei]